MMKQPTYILERESFQGLLDALSSAGYRIVGPRVQDGAIVYDELRFTNELPIGWTDEQEAGTYRLKRRDDQALFGYAVGPQSWKKYLFPPRSMLWKAVRDNGTVRFVESPTDDTKFAFLGVRSCEIHAMAEQDKVFMEVDANYRARRERLFIIAVNCGQAGKTCFCHSMNTGPHSTSGFDLSLTEVIDPHRHYLVVEVGSEKGTEIVAKVSQKPATDVEAAEIGRASKRAISQMGRSMNTDGLKDLLYRKYEHPQWDDVAKRCLSCANCTLVCPTCFCSTIDEVTDLTGDHAERWRTWDSCFTMDFSYIHGGSVRSSTRSRYRQWMTHKLGTWWDQFGGSGCVGCGRCITWCPAGIDITAEAAVIRRSENDNGKRDD